MSTGNGESVKEVDEIIARAEVKEGSLDNLSRSLLANKAFDDYMACKSSNKNYFLFFMPNMVFSNYRVVHGKDKSKSAEPLPVENVIAEMIVEYTGKFVDMRNLLWEEPSTGVIFKEGTQVVVLQLWGYWWYGKTASGEKGKRF